MNLAIFDVDGTLVTIHPNDDACYLAAIRSHEAFEDVAVSPDWSAYSFPTDSGVLHELFLKQLRRAPSRAETRQIETKYNDLLRASLGVSEPPMRAVPGADRVFSILINTKQWLPAIATGSWRESTLEKLRFVGIVADVPMASADDHSDRRTILLTALQRATNSYCISSFSKIVYIGDKLWDYDAARNVGLGFVGLTYCTDSSFPADTRLLRDFSDPAEIICALEKASA